MNFLASEGPYSKNPSSYIRFIYNRVNLEKAVIRAAAVNSLAAFAHKVPSLRASITLLLRKCLTDSDDEVRERAHFYIRIFEIQESKEDEFSKEDKYDCDEMKSFLFDEKPEIDVEALEKYVLENKDGILAEKVDLHLSTFVLATDHKSKS